VSDEEETRRLVMREILEEALASVDLALAGLAPGAKVRELRAKADTFRRALQQWVQRPPSGAQQQALRELVFALREKTMEVTPAAPPPRSRGASGQTLPREGAVPLEPLVLVVEDDNDTRRSIRDVLEEEGYSTEEATNGQEALDRLGRTPRPALVLLDLMMPVMDGRTLLLELEAHPELAALRVVVLTASAVDEASSTLRVPLLRKPVEVGALLRIVEQYSPRFWDDEEPTTDGFLAGV
jgi:CheY-like chemotaxis protein